jgi:phosphatidylglycerol:prolipoprotein diacylglycerol transferase
VHRILFHIPAEIGGIPVFGPVVDGTITRGPGLLLVLWLLFSVGLMVWVVRRQGFTADTWSYLPLLLLVAAIIWGLLPAVCDQQGFPIRGFGSMNLLAVISGTGLFLWRARRVGIDPDTAFSLAFWMILPGIVGARAFYLIEYWSESYWPVYQEHGLRALLVAVVNVTEGGLVAYAAFLGGMLGMLLFARKYRRPLLALADLVSPPIILGLALGRIGCLLNGCCFGGTCDLPWAITFPKGDWPYSPAYAAQVERGQMYGFELSGDPEAAPVLKSVDPRSSAWQKGLRRGDRLQRIGSREIDTAGDAHQALWKAFHDQSPLALRVEGREPVLLSAVPIPPRSLPVHPTQIYSSIDAFFLLLLLLAYEPFCRRNGQVFALMLSGYPVCRFLLEIVRTDESPIFGTGLTISQNISLLVLICAAGLWFYILRRPPDGAKA